MAEGKLPPHIQEWLTEYRSKVPENVRLVWPFEERQFTKELLTLEVTTDNSPCVKNASSVKESRKCHDEGTQLDNRQTTNSKSLADNYVFEKFQTSEHFDQFQSSDMCENFDKFQSSDISSAVVEQEQHKCVECLGSERSQIDMESPEEDPKTNCSENWEPRLSDAKYAICRLSTNATDWEYNNNDDDDNNNGKDDFPFADFAVNPLSSAVGEIQKCLNESEQVPGFSLRQSTNKHWNKIDTSERRNLFSQAMIESAEMQPGWRVGSSNRQTMVKCTSSNGQSKACRKEVKAVKYLSNSEHQQYCGDANDLNAEFIDTKESLFSRPEIHLPLLKSHLPENAECSALLRVSDCRKDSEFRMISLSKIGAFVTKSLFKQLTEFSDGDEQLKAGKRLQQCFRTPNHAILPKLRHLLSSPNPRQIGALVSAADISPQKVVNNETRKPKILDQPRERKNRNWRNGDQQIRQKESPGNSQVTELQRNPTNQKRPLASAKVATGNGHLHTVKTKHTQYTVIRHSELPTIAERPKVRMAAELEKPTPKKIQRIEIESCKKSNKEDLECVPGFAIAEEAKTAVVGSGNGKALQSIQVRNHPLAHISMIESVRLSPWVVDIIFLENVFSGSGSSAL